MTTLLTTIGVRPGSSVFVRRRSVSPLTCAGELARTWANPRRRLEVMSVLTSSRSVARLSTGDTAGAGCHTVVQSGDHRPGVTASGWWRIDPAQPLLPRLDIGAVAKQVSCSTPDGGDAVTEVRAERIVHPPGRGVRPHRHPTLREPPSVGSRPAGDAADIPRPGWRRHDGSRRPSSKSPTGAGRRNGDPVRAVSAGGVGGALRGLRAARGSRPAARAGGRRDSCAAVHRGSRHGALPGFSYRSCADASDAP